MINRNKKIIMILSTLFTVVLAISFTYAFFYYGKEGSTITLEAGSIAINFEEETNYFTIHDTYPKSDTMGMIDVNYYDFTVSGSKGAEDDILYEIQVEQLEGNTLTENDIKVYLTNQNDDKLMEPLLLSDAKISKYNNNRVVYSSYIYDYNQVDDYRLRVWVDSEYTENVQNTFNFKVVLYAVNEIKKLTAAETIIESVLAYNVASPTTFNGGLVAVNAKGSLYNEADKNQKIREYRYSGLNVNNYIYFNCKDNDGVNNYGSSDYNYDANNCELWRIVGVFKDNYSQWNLKLMRNNILQSNELTSTYNINGTTYRIRENVDETVVYWNKKLSGTNNNDWSTAGLQYFLNTNEDDDGVKGYYSTIFSSSKLLIEKDTAYYLGRVEYNEDTTINAYKNERDKANIWSGSKSEWYGIVGLLYPSDFGYSAHSEYWNETKLYDYDAPSVAESSWIQKTTNHIDTEWMISPESVYQFTAIRWGIATTYAGNSYTGFGNVDVNSGGVRPVLNLKSTVQLIGGDGSEEKPYKIAM